ncbi:MAG: L-2-hydroxyglutarate oxidase [Elusimicrobia bacterium]|nr:L-2-hydroxyglutarate oxidase [Elusimicrobiota bacterium]
MSTIFDAVVVGAGAVGVSTARALRTLKPGWRLGVLEKEPFAARHTSGRNSGVVHAGFNQKPGTLKAKFCVEGNRVLEGVAQRLGVPFRRIGTLVTAASDNEAKVLEELFNRGRANGVPGLEIVDRGKIASLEPNALGKFGLHAPSGGIIDSKLLVEKLAVEIKENGAETQFFSKVAGIEETAEGFRLAVVSNHETRHVLARRLVNCAGLYADQIAHFLDVGREYFIVPFRGEYWKLAAQKSSLVRSMVYPAPDPRYPFLGVHWTKKIDGGLAVGPNAVLALGRESYGFWDIRWRETLTMAANPGFLRLLSKLDFWQLAAHQIKISLSKKFFMREALRLVRGADARDLVRGPAGNRAQLVRRDGTLVDDMVVLIKGSSIHVLNAVSPGLTSSLPFGEHLAAMVAQFN